MAVQITLRGVNFNNAALPVVGNMIRTGLRGAWRFGGGYESAADLSGNEAQLTEKGQVSFTPQGVVGDLDNGFVTDLLDTTSRTYIAVFRVPASVVDLSAHNAMIINNYRDGTEREGGAMWLDGTPISVNSQQHFYDATQTESNERGSNNLKIDYQSDGHNIWLFVAAAVDAATSKHYLYVPTLKNLTEGVEYLEYDNNFDFAGKPQSVDPLEIMSVSDTSWGRALPSVVEVSEILVYDRALTLDEVKKQYEYSKEYHAKVKGITI